MSQKGDPILSMTKMFVRGTQILLSEQPQTDEGRAPRPASLAAHKGETLNAMLSSPELRPVNRRVNRYEQTEIDALIFYATRKLGDSADNIILRMMQDLGEIPFNELCVTDYLMIRAYMWKTLANAS